MMRIAMFALVLALVWTPDAAAQEVAAEGGFDPVSTLWVLLAAFMVFLMQVGFGMVDPQNLHTWKQCRIGRFLETGQFEIVWESASPIPPRPFPSSRKKTDWEIFLNELREKWGGGWSAAAQ